MKKAIFPAVYAVSNCTTINKATYEQLLIDVSTERKMRAQRFLRFEDSCRTVIAEQLLKYALKTSADIDLHSITMSENQWKKPLIDGSNVHFNLSHSGDWVMCVVDNYETGVDVEIVKKVDFGIVPRFFSIKEQAFFARCATDEERLKTFSKLWVLKESYIKAIGRGLYCPLNSFSVLPDCFDTIVLERIDSTLPHKHFKLYDIDDRYCCAVCCTENIFPQKIITVSLEQLSAP